MLHHHGVPSFFISPPTAPVDAIASTLFAHFSVKVHFRFAPAKDSGSRTCLCRVSPYTFGWGVVFTFATLRGMADTFVSTL